MFGFEIQGVKVIFSAMDVYEISRDLTEDQVKDILEEFYKEHYFFMKKTGVEIIRKIYIEK